MTTTLGHRRTDTTLLGFNSGSPFGQNFPGAIPVEQVEALFDFTVEYAPMYVPSAVYPDSFEEIPNRQAVRRTDNGHVMNVVSKRHGIHQFSDVLLPALAGLLDTGQGELQISGAGLLERGAIGWVQVQAPETMVAGDTFAPTVTVASSHNGKFATSYRCGIHRFRCSNEIGVLRRSGTNVYKVKHTLNSGFKLGEARSVLELMWTATDDFSAQVAELVETQVTDEQFSAIMHRLNPRPMPTPKSEPTAAVVSRWQTRDDGIRKMYREDERVGEFRGTGWGVVQAFSTWRQWERPVRGNSAEGVTSRLGRTMNDFIAGKIEDADVDTAEVVRQVVSA